MLKNYLSYLRDNPQGYWFKRRLFGWGWVPVRCRADLAVAIVVAGAYIGEVDDAPGMILMSFALALGLAFVFGYWKGEKPRWQWGLPDEYKRRNRGK